MILLRKPRVLCFHVMKEIKTTMMMMMMMMMMITMRMSMMVVMCT